MTWPMRRSMVVVSLFGLLGLSSVAAASPGHPNLELGAPTVTGKLSGNAIAKVVKRAKKKLLACYDAALVTTPDLEGTVAATFMIEPDGTVSAATATGLADDVHTCVAGALEKLSFAKPKNKQPVEVTFTLAFDVRAPLQQGGAFASLTGTGDISSGFDDANIYGGLLGNEAGEMNGGFDFGRSGFGPGGGGTGWGTIGTGRYGTIGSGSGTGSGYGVGSGRGGMRGKNAKLPQTRLGTAVVTGELDKAIIRRYVKRNITKLIYCYEKQLLVDAALAGKVTLRFTIGGNGTVTSSLADGLGNTDVETCMADVVKAIEFPKPKNGGDVTVTYPITLKSK
jgi:hypothetical protein